MNPLIYQILETSIIIQYMDHENRSYFKHLLNKKYYYGDEQSIGNGIVVRRPKVNLCITDLNSIKSIYDIKIV